MTTNNTDKTPLILDIKGNSLDDGPGIRSVVFFKGCPLSCVWCHNPESKKASVEIAFDPKLCINCGACRKICPPKALSRDNRYYIDRQRCDLCFQCVEICPSGALGRVGNVLSVDDIVKKILPDKPFFDVSGGGVTLSGGEPTRFMEFTSELLKRFKHHDIHTLLETCGLFNLEKFMDRLYPYVDAIYFDIKIMDREAHQKFCGTPNEKILENLKSLSAVCQQDGKVFLPRVPLVPAITDTADNLKQIASFLKALDIHEASLLEYNPLWHEKSFKIGADDPYENENTMTSFPSKSIWEDGKKIFAEAGIRVGHS